MRDGLDRDERLGSKRFPILYVLCRIQFQPPVAARALLGFVGLQNGGATCYMNSVIQQLYMQPGIREARKPHSSCHFISLDFSCILYTLYCLEVLSVLLGSVMCIAWKFYG